ncbi:hypothetical protein BLSMQ_0708 [Brevibacterium aurantiacum]|uniref:Uncharacterized protein n=1 Tax=Brevibacterium aurantiacum TaxID=273384 RepID=A0A1D7W0B6_BREAU|nr:hypothetical protein BLSMQ_0708 [Brevibacterium aurantiacum]
MTSACAGFGACADGGPDPDDADRSATTTSEPRTEPSGNNHFEKNGVLHER